MGKLNETMVRCRKLSTHHLIFVLISFLLGQQSFAFAQEKTDDLIDIVSKEIDREFVEFRNVNPAPYYIACTIVEHHSTVLGSSFGSITRDHDNDGRSMNSEVRVGDYTFDNTHRDNDIMGMYEMSFGRQGSAELPSENDAKLISNIIWRQLQGAYQSSRNVFRTLSSKATKKSLSTADFSREPAQRFVDPPLPSLSSTFNKGEWQKRVAKMTVSFLQDPDIIDGSAFLRVEHERKYFISSEGTRIAQNRTTAYLMVRGIVRTKNGESAPLDLTYFAFTPSGLPSEDIVTKDIEGMIVKLQLLKNAPQAEPYTGPAILYSRAAGVFFHEIFGHRIEGQRLKDVMDAQTFEGMVGTQVLPKNLSVISNPTVTELDHIPLNGSYKFDDEGIQSQKVTVVENGILKNFLMSRTPIDRFPNSNGHGRAQAGARPASRQANLIVENSKSMSMKDLRKMLIKECKQENKPYGYLFMEVTGGFTLTNRYIPNAFNIFPTEVYRIYVDGRADELVYGVNLIGTPLSMFAEIQGADNTTGVFTGFCGAESGSVPVTAISPSIYVKRIETQKKMESEVEGSILPPPPLAE